MITPPNPLYPHLDEDQAARADAMHAAARCMGDVRDLTAGTLVYAAEWIALGTVGQGIAQAEADRLTLPDLEGPASIDDLTLERMPRR